MSFESFSHRPKEKSAKCEPNKINRRNFLKGMLGLAGAAAIEGCKETSIEDEFFQNFDYREYEPFEASDYPERHEVEIDPSAIAPALGQAFRDYVKTDFPFEECFEYYIKDGKLRLEIKQGSIKSLNERLKKYGYSVSGDKISMELQKQGESRKIQIFNSNFAIFLATMGDDGYENVCWFHIPEADAEVETPTCYWVELISKEDNILETEKAFGGAGDGTRVDVSLDISEFQMPNGKKYKIKNTQTLIDALRNSPSEGALKSFVQERVVEGIRLRDIKSVSQLREIFRLLPKDPQTYSGFLWHAARYAAKDKELDDEFRHPITTLRSGWADCDDFALLHYFWAYLHNYRPRLVYLKPKDNKDSHVLVWCQTTEGLTAVLDNANATVLSPEQTLEDYLTQWWPGYKVALNKEL